MTDPRPASAARRLKVVVVDVGRTRVKVPATGRRTPRTIPSGPSMTGHEMVSAVKQLTADWRHDAVSIGDPGLVIHG